VKRGRHVNKQRTKQDGSPHLGAWCIITLQDIHDLGQLRLHCERAAERAARHNIDTHDPSHNMMIRQTRHVPSRLGRSVCSSTQLHDISHEAHRMSTSLSGLPQRSHTACTSVLTTGMVASREARSTEQITSLYVLSCRSTGERRLLQSPRDHFGVQRELHPLVFKRKKRFFKDVLCPLPMPR